MKIACTRELSLRNPSRQGGRVKRKNIYVRVCVCLYTNSYVRIHIYTCVRITDYGLQRLSPAVWITGLRSIRSVVNI